MRLATIVAALQLTPAPSEPEHQKDTIEKHGKPKISKSSARHQIAVLKEPMKVTIVCPPHT